VAVVDSGIHGAHPHVGGVQGGIAVLEDGRFESGYVDRLGHGTAVAAAIREKAPGADLFAIRVFHGELAASVASLVAAIEWAAEAGLRLVNLSLGTSNPAREAALQRAVDAAERAGTIVVSAAEQGGTRWWPGALPGTVGVLLDWSCDRNAVRLVRDGSRQRALAASGLPRPIPGVSPARNLSGISFSVANTTGVLARLLEARPEITAAGDLLRRAAACSGSGSSAGGLSSRTGIPPAG
jgi:subtilisin family serine protease